MTYLNLIKYIVGDFETKNLNKKILIVKIKIGSYKIIIKCIQIKNRYNFKPFKFTIVNLFEYVKYSSVSSEIPSKHLEYAYL